MAVVLLSPLLFAASSSAHATDINVLKGVYLYNFVRFTQWPGAEGIAKSIQVAVFDSVSFAELLRQVSNKSRQRPKMIIDECRSLDCSPHMQAVFIHNNEAMKRQYIIDRVASKAVLTISDQQGFLQQGGMIELQEVDNRLVFSINLYALKKAGLYISADILDMAYHLIREPR
jgi:hypothetical protein